MMGRNVPYGITNSTSNHPQGKKVFNNQVVSIERCPDQELVSIERCSDQVSL